ncbi:transglycosylase SLT domain-containing protein [Candidatus Poribacteria bacterium]|nr:transglycosylase SLT domain-containing protein [Candidatus Poribacteria bacterium]
MRTVKAIPIFSLILIFSLLIGGVAFSASIFTVVGTVKNPDDTLAATGLEVAVGNENRKLAVATILGKQEAGRYGVVFIDTENKTVAADGDVLKVTVKDAQKVQGTHTYKLTADDIAKARAIVDIKLGPPSEGEITDDFLNAVFEEAARTYNIPSNLLRAIAYEESRWKQSARAPDGGVGIMQLTGLLETAAKLIKMEPAKLVEVSKEGARANIIGAAAILKDMFDHPSGWTAGGLPLVDPGDPPEALETWWWIVARYNGGGADGKLTTTNYPFRVYNWLRNGVPNRIPKIDISFPPGVTSREGTEQEKAKLEVTDRDAQLFPLAPLGHIRITPPDFKVQDLVLHGNDGSIIPNPGMPPIDAMPWEVDGNGAVDIFDLALVARAFGASGKGIAADVNGDGVVNILDLVMVAAHFGETRNPSQPAAPWVSNSPHVENTNLVAGVLEGWLTEARTMDDGSAIFRRGIAILESLLNAIVPEKTALLPAYPNPFNPETWIPYQLSEASEVTMTIYDARGGVVKRIDLGYQPAGTYRTLARAAHWDSRNEVGEPVASGVYFVELRTNKFQQAQRIVLLK